MIRTWFNQRLQERLNRQGYDEQGHILQQQVQRNINDLVQDHDLNRGLDQLAEEEPAAQPAQPPAVENMSLLLLKQNKIYSGQKVVSQKELFEKQQLVIT